MTVPAVDRPTSQADQSGTPLAEPAPTATPSRAAPPNTREASALRSRGRSSWKLRTKLIAAVLALFFLVTAATGVATVLLGRSFLNAQLDRDLRNDAGRVIEHHGGRLGGDNGFVTTTSVNATAPLLLALRDGAVATDDRGEAINRVLDERTNTVALLTPAQITLLKDAGVGMRPVTVNLGGELGSYRVIASYDPASSLTVISGIPTSQVDRVVTRLALLVASGIMLGLALVAGGGSLLIRRALEPLNRVAATAARVSTLKLASGEVALAERVAPGDTSPNTEVGQVGLALNHMLDNVEGALQARQESETRVRQFVADASHELRTPLASIRGYAELSRREREPVPPAVSHALDRVESEALRMTSLVEDLLLLARLDEGRPLERSEVDLTMLAVDAVSDAHAASPRHTWELDVPDDPVSVQGDQARLHQVLTNLLANARVHTPEGTRVVTSIRREGDMVRLVVTDNGPGIPESLQRNVFERFTRGDDSRSRAAGSTGLGLSIVAAVGQAHGGSVDVTSKPGETRFSVLLPAG